MACMQRYRTANLRMENVRNALPSLLLCHAKVLYVKAQTDSVGLHSDLKMVSEMRPHHKEVRLEASNDMRTTNSGFIDVVIKVKP